MTAQLWKIVILSKYNGCVQFRVYQDGGHVIHGHIFELYYGNPYNFIYNQNLN